MSLDYVRRGEAVRASTVNSLIDAVAGSGSLSPDLIVTGTPRGPQFTAPTQFGSASFDLTMLYDLSNYILSGWPMTQLMLGMSPDMCLNGIKIHQGKDIVHPVSAAVVYKNSTNCPVDSDTLSGYVLIAKNFGEDRAAGATGWVKTSMEGIYAGKEVLMQVWKSGSDLYQVFTNTGDNDTKNGLSIALKDNGVPLSALSSLEKEYSWQLKSQEELSAKVNNLTKYVPTSRVTYNLGQQEVFETSTVDMKAVLKAKLVMYHLKEDEENDSKTQLWTWLVPMLPDAEYDSKLSAVFMSQLTYGGDKVLVEAPKANLDESYDGSTSWIEDLNCLAFSKISCYEGGTVNAGELWMNLSYDYLKYATTGSLDSSKGDESSESMPSKCIFIASAADFTPASDTAEMQEAPLGTLTHGTFGDMFKDGPKLDTYCALCSGVEMKSLNWTTRGQDLSTTATECHCMQLYNFDNAEMVDPTSSDMYVARRYNSDTSCAEIVYLPAGLVIPDSSYEDALTSSILFRNVLTTDNDGDTVSAKVLQSWKFDLMDDYYSSLSDALENLQHVFLRNADTSAVEYIALSALSSAAGTILSVDSDGLSGQKSIGWLDDDGTSELLLWNFDLSGEAPKKTELKAGALTPVLADGYEFVVRKNGAGGEVSYLSVELSLSGLSNDLSSSIVTIVKDNISCDLPDADVAASLMSSLQTRELLNGQKVLQLYKFNELQHSNALSTDDLVLRRGNYIEYAPAATLSSALSVSIADIAVSKLSALSATPDADLSSARLSSIQTRELQDHTKVLQLFLFDNGQVKDPLSTDHIVVRRADHVEYVSLSSLSSSGGISDVDSEKTQNLKSMLKKTAGDSTYLQLYNMDQAGETLANVLLSTDFKPLLPLNYEFVLRKGGAGGQISYATLSTACLSGGSGGDVTLSGTDNSSHTGTAFKFQSATNSNINVTIDNTGVMTIGAYYI